MWLVLASAALEVDLSTLFDSINYWFAALLPILAIGIGIAIAIALIGFIGDNIKGAFRR